MPAATLLAVFAHPDDESYLCGGTLARYASQGVHVVLVCATRGEAGQIADPALATPEGLPVVREAELRAACGLLGVADVRLLDYRDGMPLDVPFPEGVERMSAALAAVRPTVVVTFGPEGVYGHPDHVAVHRWVKEAFHVARVGPASEAASSDSESPAPDSESPTLVPGLGPPAAAVAQRLYYCAPPRSWYQAISERCRARGLPDRYGPRLAVYGVPDELATTRLDVGPQAPARLAAIRAHATQLPADHAYRVLPDGDLHELLAAEWFTRAWPPVPAGAPMEVDLFAGDDPAR